MIKTKLDVTINVGGSRTENRTLIFDLGLAVNGFSQTGQLVQFPVLVYKKLTGAEVAILTRVIPTPEGDKLEPVIEGQIIKVLSNGDVYIMIESRIASYKISTYNTIMGDTKISGFEAAMYTVMMSQIDYVTANFNNWDLIEQYKVGDYWGLIEDQLEIITG